MGLTASIEAKAKEVMLTQRVLDLRQKKRERDMQQSMQIAATRDRLLWIGCYYGFLSALSGVRHIVMHRRGVHFTWDSFFLPLNQIAVCIPPFLFGYQLDYALGSKVLPAGSPAHAPPCCDTHPCTGLRVSAFRKRQRGFSTAPPTTGLTMLGSRRALIVADGSTSVRRENPNLRGHRPLLSHDSSSYCLG